MLVRREVMMKKCKDVYASPILFSPEKMTSNLTESELLCIF